MIKSKILILLLSSYKYPSPRNELIQKKTWVKDAESSGVKVVNFIGGSNELIYDEPYLKLVSGDSIEDVGYKTIEAFDWCLKNVSFEYIFRVNSSSFVDISELIAFTESLQNQYVYCGSVKNISMWDLSFISGSGILLNKNTINKILEHKELWDHSLIDDVALGKICNQIGIVPSEGQFFEVSTNVLKYVDIEKSYHIRCKLEDYGYPRFLESYNLRLLYSIKSGKKINIILKYLYIFVYELIKIINIKYYLNKYIFRNRRLRNKIRKYVNIFIGK